MISEALERFFFAVLQNPAWQEKFKEADTPEKAIELAVHLGNMNGYEFTSEDLKIFIQQSGGSCDEINDADRREKWAMFSLIRVGCVERMRQYEAQKKPVVSFT